MFINGNDKVGQAKVYASVKEMELEKENKELKHKLDLAVGALTFIYNEEQRFGCMKDQVIYRRAKSVLESMGEIQDFVNNHDISKNKKDK